MSLRQTLRGTGVALVTPFTSSGAIDFNALEKVINTVIDGGVDYVVTLGTTGEAPTLDKQEKTDIIRFTLEKAQGKVPVVVGIGGNNTRAIIQDMENFPLSGATAILSASPYYNKPSQEGLFQHYKALAQASPLPIVMYNVPARTGRNMEAATTLRLAHEVPNIAGIKEASDNIDQCMQILREKPEDFLVVSGDDNLVLPQMSTGMDGVISVAANCFSEPFSAMVRYALAGNFTEAISLNNAMMPAYKLLFAENNPAGVKAFLTVQGILENNLRLPLVPVSEGLMKQIQAFQLAH